MNKIRITHNPFTIETIFEINGELIHNIAFIEQNKNRRLQLWVEELFPVFCNDILGESNLDIEFIGVETDWIDIQDAIKKANDQGMNIKGDWIKAEDSITRLNKIQKLMEEAKQHPIFKDKLENKDSKIYQDFNAALNRDFDVYVAATMSSGKSTFINAMLGCDLLPAANEATTATIAEITDNDQMEVGKFLGCRINKEDQIVDEIQLISLETLKLWNSQVDTKLIKLEGKILGVKERDDVRLVITDTPGPNNSQDQEHHRTTMQHIQDSVRNPLILYILNATQLGTNDDKQVLSEIAQIMQKGGKQSKDRFIFIVNKMDCFDPEAGENVEEALKRVENYLKENGIEDPLIYPVSANLTRLLRKREYNPDSLTRKERGDLLAMEDLFIEEPTMNLIQYMQLTKSAKDNLDRKNLPDVLKRSGVPAIESMIDEYINKYNLPNRVNRAYQALQEAIRISSDQNKVIAELKEYSNDLEKINEELKKLNSNKNFSAKAKAKMKAIIEDKKSLYPLQEIQQIDEEEAKIRQTINEFQDDFVGDEDTITPAKAKRKLSALTKDIKFESNRLINNLESIILASQEITQTKLKKIFDEYVKDLFSNLDQIPLPILNGLKAQVGNLANITGLGLNRDEIETKTERVKVGTETVSKSKWYNPFSWGKTEKINVYEEQKIEVVYTDNLWEERESQISHYFNQLILTAKNKIEEDTETYAQSFADFMQIEFQKKLDEIISNLQEKTQNKAKTEKLVKEAEDKLQQIEEFQQKLNNVLNIGDK